MSFVFAAPEALAAAAADMAGIGSTLNAANVVAAVPTTGVLAAAADEVSTQVAALLSAHAQGYQQLSRQMMTAFHDQFVQALRASADAYATAEASAAQTMVNAVNAPARALLGHPLISAAPDQIQQRHVRRHRVDGVTGKHSRSFAVVTSIRHPLHSRTTSLGFLSGRSPRQLD